MFDIKVYKYDSSQEANGYRGQEFSNAILQGCEVKEDITQEMDTAEITLCGQTFQEEFLPQTKFIIDYYEDDELLENETRHWVVQKDMVEQPILSDDHYFDHHISLIEPSVIAQQRLVDNISVTYKLKDVTLETEEFFNDVSYKTNFASGEFSPLRNFGKTEKIGFVTYEYFTHGKYFALSDEIKVYQSGTEKTNYYVNIQNDSSIYFVLPHINILAGVNNSANFINIGRASYDYLIEEFSVYNENVVLNTWSGSMIENTPLNNNYYGGDIRIKDEWILENAEVINTIYGKRVKNYYKKYVDVMQVSSPTYQTQTINARPNCLYKVTMFLHEFGDSVPVLSGIDADYYGKYEGTTPIKVSTIIYQGIIQTEASNVENVYLESSNVSASATIRTYNDDSQKILLKSSVPYSALTLLEKAIINSGNYEKIDGVAVTDVNNSNLPFVIDTQFIDKLKDTSIIENFYNQKNLWEIMLDVGHYIHAIPELKFGADDKFLITFNELGRTDQKENLGTKVSIFNSRGVEDYIASTSSYVANMVQLGGEIREWVAPKTSSDDLLVYNDTAEIIVSKPIIELLEVRVKKIANNSDNGIPQGTEKDMTKFIFEKNVYNILGIDYKLVPNRGIAMYYELGTNKIIGGNYQLPQANTNMYTDYAFKKIIYCACKEIYSVADNPLDLDQSAWYNLKVNDYVFFVRYRAKDTVRQNHTRPDLRKYLMNSKYDRYPEHNQFNNQTDVLVDSEKFGNNLFGKLIKTGNSTYEITEWHQTFGTVKKKGELYRINGELYYVAKVTNYIYVSHIVSQVTFSKDYNELSVVIGIPSEPRFYEISEQSSIKREVALNDLILLTDNLSLLKTSIAGQDNFIRTVAHLAGIIFGNEIDYARYALTVFKGDKDNIEEVSQQDFYREILSPINAYSSGNTLTYEWDMVDNYSAGDKIIDTDTPDSAMEGAYKSLLGVNYTDVYGKSALMDFFLFGDVMSLVSDEEIKTLPLSPILTHNVNIAGISASQTPTSQYLTAFINTKYNRPPIDYDAVALPNPSSGVNKGTFNLVSDLGLDVSLMNEPRVIISSTISGALLNNPQIGQPNDGDYCYVEIPISNDDTNTIIDIMKFGTRQSLQHYTWTFKSYLKTYVYLQEQWVKNAIYYKEISNLWDKLYATSVTQQNMNYNGRGFCLLKDNREQISVNYNLRLITNSDTFVVSPFVLKPNKPNLKVVFLAQEVNKLSDGYISQGEIIRDISYTEYGVTLKKTYFEPHFSFATDSSQTWFEGLYSQLYIEIAETINTISDDYFTGENGKQKIKSIALVYNVIDDGVQINDEALVVYKLPFVIAKNIPENWTKQDVAKDWYIGVPIKDAVFTKKQ